VAPQIIGFIFICALSVTATHRDWIQPTMMVTYFYLFMRFVQSFSELVRLSSSISYSLPMATRFAQWWDAHSHDGTQNSAIKNTVKETQSVDFKGPIGWKLENISFAYPNSTQQIFNNYSLHIPEGSSLVIIGESGSGKSTLLSLLLGISVPQKGSITLEREQQKYPLAKVRQSLLPHVGYVGSESFLIEGTIRDNLVYGLDAMPSEIEIQDALNKSECDFIPRLSEGLNHFITEQGQGLSAGQKQRLSFARALLRNPQVLILDEATANLDSETEKNLIKTLMKLKRSTTIVTVTHREALLTIADQVVKFPQV
jgi:ABC-type multidrug transport system fused ATPase/permease subunit